VRLREWAVKWLVGAAAFLYDLFGSLDCDPFPMHFIPHSLSGSLRVFLTKYHIPMESPTSLRVP
jgi:hypothetical protein